MSTLRRLLGDDSTASMTLASLTEGFERQQLIGKTLAIIADTRLSRHTDVAKLLEILLTISGRDNPSIPRKYRDAYEGPLYVWFFIASNEALRFLDSTGAVVNRFIILKTVPTTSPLRDVRLQALCPDPQLPGRLLRVLCSVAEMRVSNTYLR